MKCQRCGTQTNTYRCSWFNEQMICTTCAEKEKKREDYQTCRKLEHEAVMKGNLNFNYTTPWMGNG